MAGYRREGTFEKPYLTMNGIAMLLVLIALGLVEAIVIVSVRSPGLRWTLPWNLRKRISVRPRKISRLLPARQLASAA